MPPHVTAALQQIEERTRLAEYGKHLWERLTEAGVVGNRLIPERLPQQDNENIR